MNSMKLFDFYLGTIHFEAGWFPNELFRLFQLILWEVFPEYKSIVLFGIAAGRVSLTVTYDPDLFFGGEL
jgi:hypothetical protein